MTVNLLVTGLLDQAIKDFGQHTLHDKGASEVMNMDLVERLMRASGVQDALDTLAAIKAHPHGDPLFDELYTEFVENDTWPELAEAWVHPGVPPTIRPLLESARERQLRDILTQPPLNQEAVTARQKELVNGGMDIAEALAQAREDVRAAQVTQALADQKWIVVTGNPVDGLSFFGPFDTHEDAVEYAEVSFRGNDGNDWWVAPITPAVCDEDGEWVTS